MLGVFAGFVALAFVRLLYLTEDLFDAVKVWPPAKAVIGGATIGVIALWFPEIFGVGYEAIDDALYGHMAGSLLIMLVAIKIIAVSITIGSGGSGGIFAPSLFIGAMAGGAFGTLVHGIWPEATAGPGAYALVGMVAVVGATTHAPITAIVIIFELTKDYEIMLPMMISAIIATLIATQLQKGSIYTIKLLRRGVDIHAGQDVSLLRHVLVRDEMRTDLSTVPPGAGLMELVSMFIEHPGMSIFVVDDQRKLLGVITVNQSRAVLTNASAFEAFIIAQDLMQETDFPTVRPGDTLADVMRRLSRYRGEVPVVEHGRLVGAIWPEDVIARYNAELFKRDMASSMVSTVSRSGPEQPIPVVENTSMAEIAVPSRFVGKSLGSLDIRNRCQVTVLLIKRPAPLVAKWSTRSRRPTTSSAPATSCSPWDQTTSSAASNAATCTSSSPSIACRANLGSPWRGNERHRRESRADHVTRYGEPPIQPGLDPPSLYNIVRYLLASYGLPWFPVGGFAFTCRGFVPIAFARGRRAASGRLCSAAASGRPCWSSAATARPNGSACVQGCRSRRRRRLCRKCSCCHMSRAATARCSGNWRTGRFASVPWSRRVSPTRC